MKTIQIFVEGGCVVNVRGLPKNYNYEIQDKDVMSKCLECKKYFHQDRDLQICDKCMNKFDVDKLWELHDKNELDALDFNESKSFREKFRK